ncbi:MAG: 4-demethylwyosine synthase TYW1 [Candidatus Aenigmarchaeota archaeon]|nr:4-demethylwyosine synthase TYW1 [Candidatus Aenigmarchaeota archaeon]MDW8149434.1 4-demethylwyosine synthase TYW1 [Candidatus Aenigmarchaeota archaeon]
MEFLLEKFSKEWIEKYKKAHYKIIGKYLHSAVSLCRWTKSVLRGGKNCYKKWYGIASHRCIQMTPTLDFCNFSCVFCWRSFSKDRFEHKNGWDDPKTIVNEAIKAQKELISGFGGNPKTSKKIFEEANKPMHFAISLDGEPTLYPYLSELIKEIKDRGFTVFLVTNGTIPSKLKELLEKDAIPTNLYISVYATNNEDYIKITNSLIPNPFEKVVESLKFMKEFEKRNCRTVFRITCVKFINMYNAEGFSKLINLSKPMFVELKGYAWLGESRKRLGKNNVPSMQDLLDFAKEISSYTGYKIKATDNNSRVVLLIRDENILNFIENDSCNKN